MVKVNHQNQGLIENTISQDFFGWFTWLERIEKTEQVFGVT